MQLHCLEVEVHVKDVLKCIITTDGEPCVMIDLISWQQGLFASLLDSDTLDGRLTLTATELAMEPSGWMMFSVMEQKDILVRVLIGGGTFTTVYIMKTLLSPVLETHLHQRLHHCHFLC